MVRGLRVKVDSAGTSGYHAGDPPDRRSVATMRTVDIDISGQRSRKFVRADFQKFDRILVMDRANLADVLSLARSEEEREKVALFDPSGAEVPTLLWRRGRFCAGARVVGHAACPAQPRLSH